MRATTRSRYRCCRSFTFRPNPARCVAARYRSRAYSHWLRFKVQEISVPIMSGALEIRTAHTLSYWDAANVAAARALGCQELYSEDMSHGREVEGVTIINPFR
jgi:predicted nucleic acid-binding protein